MIISVPSKCVKLRGSHLVLDTRLASRSPAVRVAMLDWDSQGRLLAYLRSLLHRDVDADSDCSDDDDDDDNIGGGRGPRKRSKPTSRS